MKFDSDLPMGAGISSSACFNTGCLSMLLKYFEIEVKREEIARSAMYIEHYFTGTKCGLMD